MKVGSSKGRKICVMVTGVVIAIVLLIVILALTVFKAKHPVNKVDSVKLEDMNVSLDLARLKVDLNLTLDVDVSVKNPNKVGFKYSNSSAHLNYRGQVVGEVPIPAGEISSDETKGFNLTLTIMADRLLSNSQVYSDVISGTYTIPQLKPNNADRSRGILGKHWKLKRSRFGLLWIDKELFRGRYGRNASQKHRMERLFILLGRGL